MKKRYPRPKRTMLVSNHTTSFYDLWEDGGDSPRVKQAVRRQFKAKERSRVRQHISDELRSLEG